ncbi:MAG: hypothetical protein MUO43_00310, partial [Desulfobacterales bacterium]|nr:hypothetical protein [Desulfobacterales bacterium]
PEDIPHLIEYYIQKYSDRFNAKQLSKPGKEVMDKLLAYHWPGNIRELQNVLKKVILLKDWEEVINELFISDTTPNKSTFSYYEIEALKLCNN